MQRNEDMSIVIGSILLKQKAFSYPSIFLTLLFLLYFEEKYSQYLQE